MSARDSQLERLKGVLEVDLRQKVAMRRLLRSAEAWLAWRLSRRSGPFGALSPEESQLQQAMVAAKAAMEAK